MINRKGFSLIELIFVIIIVGIAAVSGYEFFFKVINSGANIQNNEKFNLFTAKQWNKILNQNLENSLKSSTQICKDYKTSTNPANQGGVECLDEDNTLFTTNTMENLYPANNTFDNTKYENRKKFLDLENVSKNDLEKYYIYITNDRFSFNNLTTTQFKIFNFIYFGEELNKNIKRSWKYGSNDSGNTLNTHFKTYFFNIFFNSTGNVLKFNDETTIKAKLSSIDINEVRKYVPNISSTDLTKWYEYKQGINIVSYSLKDKIKDLVIETDKNMDKLKEKINIWLLEQEQNVLATSIGSGDLLYKDFFITTYAGNSESIINTKTLNEKINSTANCFATKAFGFSINYCSKPTTDGVVSSFNNSITQFTVENAIIYSQPNSLSIDSGNIYNNTVMNLNPAILDKTNVNPFGYPVYFSNGQNESYIEQNNNFDIQNGIKYNRSLSSNKKKLDGIKNTIPNDISKTPPYTAYIFTVLPDMSLIKKELFFVPSVK